VQGRIRDKLKECLRDRQPVGLTYSRWAAVKGQLENKGVFNTVGEALDIQEIAGHGFLWDKVCAKVEGLGCEMVDITVHGEHSYVAAGFISHNSYGLAYGMSPWALASRLDISEELAMQLYNLYFQTFSKIKAWIKNTQRFARRDGYVETYWGRVRHVDNEYQRGGVNRGDRSAINTVIQGTAAEVMRRALVNTHFLMRNKYGEKVFLIATLHDQILFEVANDIVLEDFVKDVREGMEMDRPDEWLCPLVVDVSYGQSWGELKDLKKKEAVKPKKKRVVLEAMQNVPEDLIAEVNMITESLPAGNMGLWLKMGNNEAELKQVTMDKLAMQRIEEAVGEYFSVRIEDVNEDQPTEPTPSN